MAPDREAFAASIRRPDGEIDLASAALHIAEIVTPVPVPERYIQRLDEDAAWLRTRIDPDGDQEQALRRMCHFLAVDRDFHGNTRDYYDPRNSCLNHVLERRTGLPITLSLVYLEVGWRLGLPMAGVGLPGHFLVKAVGENGDTLVDPFHGGAILSEVDCAERLQRALGRPIALEPHHLAAVTRKQILSRMLGNLKHIFLRPPAADLPRALETIEFLLVLSPWALDEVRDRGTVLSMLGHTDAAMRDLETYVHYAHDAADADWVRQRLAGLRRRLPPGR
ncbi:MAG: transglutaminase family protein [Chloroflexi bacterium]|nr:transglutaminase family protein [Chloroflexota bacterium]